MPTCGGHPIASHQPLVVVQVGTIGVVVGNFHTLKVFEPHGIPNIRVDDAPEADCSQTPIACGVGLYTLDLHVFTRPGLSFAHARWTTHSPYSLPQIPHQLIFRSST